MRRLPLLLLLLCACEKDYSFERGNEPPLARAGGDRTLPPGADTAYLDGTASTDGDGTLTAYRWEHGSGPGTPTLSHPDSAVTTVTGLLPGIHLLTLEVTDDDGAKDLDTVVLTLTGPPDNKPPIAAAGPDRNLPDVTTIASLDGSASQDPDGRLTAYQWTALQPGPHLTTPTAPVTEVTGLTAGTFAFRLLVTDNQGAQDADTVTLQVAPPPPLQMERCDLTVRPVRSAQLIPFGRLSTAKAGAEAVRVGSELLFIGGSTYAGGLSPHVDIYDLRSRTWRTDTLEGGSLDAAIATLGSKVIIAGGHDGSGTGLDEIRLYDGATRRWSSARLHQRRTGAAAVAVDGEWIVIAGGQEDAGAFPAVDAVDIYHGSSSTWTTARMSSPRTYMKGLSIGGTSYFLGGAAGGLAQSVTTDIIEAYDPATGRWSVPHQLTRPVAGLGGIAVGSEDLIVAGGNLSLWSGEHSARVEWIRPPIGNKGISCLSIPRTALQVVRSGDEVLFFGYPGWDTFDIFHTGTGKWSIGRLPFSLAGAAIIAVDNEVFVAGGTTPGALKHFDQVWKLVW